MRVRTKFVSNSSSSSFCCGVCGRGESGYDVPPKDFGMVQCEAGHMVCESQSVVSRDEMFLYLCRQYNLKPDEIESHIRSQFECREDFLNYIKDR